MIKQNKQQTSPAKIQSTFLAYHHLYFHFQLKMKAFSAAAVLCTLISTSMATVFVGANGNTNQWSKYSI